MFIQIEITTHCNYECFYCAGRDMVQRHMPTEQFIGILNRMPQGRHQVSLQGEGEPMTHPEFWALVRLVRERGHTPYTITNGSRLEPELIAKHFPYLGISLDTLDPVEAERIGRHKLPQMLANVNRLLESYSPSRVIIHTVNYGQDMRPVMAFVKEKRIGRHVIQPLQTKDDYAYRYRDRIEPTTPDVSYRCRFIERQNTRFYNIAGIEMPCPFIKDASKFVSTSAIRDAFARQEVPMTCRGCRELTSKIRS